MKIATLQAALGSALLLLSAHTASASNSHRRAHNHYGKRHSHGHEHNELMASPVAGRDLEDRDLECTFPFDDPHVVPVTQHLKNKGWAMPPDRACTVGNYCPIACKPGMVMNQWQKGSSYVYPQSMNGGLYCDKGGVATKPFPDRPLCVEGTGAVQAVNKAGKTVAFCQTTLPGDEAMVIPTAVDGTVTIAVPGPNYWAATASHFYIGPPGVSTDDCCVWGSEDKPWGNWAAYVAGANTVAGGTTFLKIGMNPIYMDSKWKSVKPSYGLRIECPDGGCNGLPCSIGEGDVGVTESPSADVGAGGASFCVVTVPSGSTANIVVFNTDGSTGDDSEETSSSSEAEAPTTSTQAQPTTTSTTSSAVPTTTSEETTSTTSSSSSSSSSSSTEPSSSSTPATTSKVYSVLPGIFRENGTSTVGVLSTGGSVTAQATITTGSPTNVPIPTTTASENDAMNPDQGGAAIAGLVVALVAAAWLY